MEEVEASCFVLPRRLIGGLFWTPQLNHMCSESVLPSFDYSPWAIRSPQLWLSWSPSKTEILSDFVCYKLSYFISAILCSLLPGVNSQSDSCIGYFPWAHWFLIFPQGLWSLSWVISSTDILVGPELTLIADFCGFVLTICYLSFVVSCLLSNSVNG